jgi:hypothetical protein
MKRFMNSPHISRIAQSEIEKEMQGMSTFLDIGKKQGIVVLLDNNLIFQMVAGASYNLIEYAIHTGSKIQLEHIQMMLNMVKTNKE